MGQDDNKVLFVVFGRERSAARFTKYGARGAGNLIIRSITFCNRFDRGISPVRNFLDLTAYI
jgi:hypothetical protein